MMNGNRIRVFSEAWIRNAPIHHTKHVPATSAVSYALLLVAFLGGIGLQAQTRPLSRIATQANAMASAPMPLVAPLFFEGRDFRSTIVIVNSINESMIVDVEVRGAEQEPIAQTQ